MKSIYNIIVNIVNVLIHCTSYFLEYAPKSKFKFFALGQKDILGKIKDDIECGDVRLPIIWVHAASLGEYGVARPIIEKLKKEHNYRILLTFFSPTGIEAIGNKHPNIDYVHYLPLDTLDNAKGFLDIVKPVKAMFVVSEYWFNYLSELKDRNIATYLISVIVNDNSIFFKWYGSLHRRFLSTYSHVMVLNEKSKNNLGRLGLKDNVTVIGDSLFDNVKTVANTYWNDAIVSKFAENRNIFVAGSISDNKDLQLVVHIANKYRDTHFIFVPHEISEEKLNQIKYELNGYAILYSECDENTDFSKVQVLVIDFLGALAYVYRYATCAYVGGGFTPFLHNILEATVYGVPVAFGPNISRKVTPNELIELGIGKIVKNERDIDDWFVALKENKTEQLKIKEKAKGYINRKLGATDTIIDIITDGDNKVKY